MKKILLVMILIGSIFFITPGVHAAAVSWDAGGDGSTWNNANNWSNNQVPTSADDVTLDPAVTVNLTVGTTIHSLTVSNTAGSTAPTLNFSYNAISGIPLTISGGNLTVGNSASISHSAGNTAPVASVYIDVTSGDATITGSINIAGKGYRGGSGPGSPTGYGTNRGGGGYGGTGGKGTSQSGGTIYGSLTEPVDLGSGGGAYNSTNTTFIAPSGGGAMRLRVSGILTVNGSINANAQNYVNLGTQSGASGGSVYITTGTLSGSGTISSNGGAAYGYDGGAGGGGRIAVYYTTNNLNTANITAYGGANTPGFGGAGTIYLKAASQTNGTLKVDNNNNTHFATYYNGITPLYGTYTFDSIVLSNYGNLEIGSSTNLTATSIDWATKGILTDNGGTYDLLSGGGAISIPATATLYANSARTWSSITLDGIMTHYSNLSTELTKLNVTVTGNMSIGTSGRVDVSYRGYSAGRGPGAPSGINSADRGGSGHGGEGGMGAGQVGGGVYGSIIQPDTLGSGGGTYAYERIYYSGAGGGAAKLTVNGTLSVNGSIQANGQNASFWNISEGGGAGGSIYLIAGTLNGSGTITANGGASYDNSGGGGGGGRIAIYYTSNTFSTSSITSYGGASGKGHGGAGTIFLKATSDTNGSVYIDNNNQLYAYDYFIGRTPIGGTNTFDSINLSNYGNLYIGATANISYSTLNWSTKGVITDNGGTFALTSGGGSATIPETAILFANTPRTFTGMTVNGIVTHTTNWTTEVYKAIITVNGDVSIGSNGRFDVSMRGFRSGYGAGSPATAVFNNSGGGYGGIGGAGRDNPTGGSTYGSMYQPTDLGSGGGKYSQSSYFSGWGGGALKLTVSGTLTLNGQIKADGGAYIDTPPYAGGSGGSVYLIVGTINGNGTITANGGAGVTGGAGGGGGGGGRIAIYYQNSTHSGSITVNGGAGYAVGQVGTVVKKPTQAELISTAFDSADAGNVVNQISWDETLQTGTDAKFQIRTAPDVDGAPGTWTDWLGPTGTGDYYTDPTGGDTINENHRDGVDDQWLQYKAILTAQEGDQYISSVQQVDMQYVVNTAPTVSITSNPSQNTDGIVLLSYSVSDPEESNFNAYLFVDLGVSLSSDLAKANTSSISLSNATYFPSAGTIMIDNEMISYTSKSGNTLGGTITRGTLTTRDAAHSSSTAVYFRASTVAGAVGTVAAGTGKNIVWTPRTDISNLETTSARVKVVVNDGNAANQIGSDLSPLFILDTKAPVSTDLFIDSRLDKLTLQATDANSIFIKLSNNSDLTSDGLNGTSGTWVGLTTPYSWTMPSGTETVYVRYKDAYGNESSTVNMTAPKEPSSVVIQDASNPDTSEWRLFVTWAVSEIPPNGFAYYQVYRSLDNVTFSPLAQVSTRTQNFYLDSNLSSTQSYYYKVTVVDNHGNESSYNTINQVQGSASRSGVGLKPDGSGGADYTAPVISGLTVSDVTTSSATFTWTTDEVSDSKIGYSTTTSYANEIGSPSMVTNHSVTITGLSSGTKYYYRAISYDIMSNKGTKEDSSTYYFTTSSDNDAPVISNINVTASDTGAGITWSTDEPATSVVDYGLTSSYGTASSSASLVSGHAIHLTGLTSGKSYYYRVKSSDEQNNEGISVGDTFVTISTVALDTVAPSIGDIGVSKITATSATVSWTTGEKSDGKVEYGESTDYERGVAEGNHLYTTSKEVVIIGLSPGTTYHYKIVAVDEAGNVNYSSDATFTTSDQEVLSAFTDGATSSGENAPSISSNGPSVTEVTAESVTITWTTSKKSTSQILFKPKGSTDALKSGGDATLFVTEHEIILDNLTPATTYEYQVKSSDVNGNYVISSKYEFSTSLPEVASVKVVQVTESSATINWKTAIPTSALLEYINTKTEEKDMYKTGSLATNHEAILTKLAGSTIYSFTIVISDEKNNVSRSSQYSFTTDKDSAGPAISVVNSRSTVISGQNKVQTIITWTTDEPSKNKVEYALGGAGDTFDQATEVSSDYLTNHIVILSGLNPATVYRYRVASLDRTGNTTYSDPYVLLTPQREVSALDLIIKNLEGTFGWMNRK